MSLLSNILDLKVELQTKESPEQTDRESSENWRNYEPESEEIRQSFSKLGDIKISKAVPLLISLAPILTTLFGYYFAKTTINYCYTIPNRFWNTTDTINYVSKLYEKAPLSSCILCNGESSSFVHAVDSGNNLTKGIVGKLIYLYGFYLIYYMFQDASMAIKLLAYKVRVKCNKYNSQVFIFFGCIFAFSVAGTAGLANPYPKSLAPCSNVSVLRLYAAEVEFPTSQLWYFRQFSNFIVLMAGFFTLFLALMRDAPGVFIKIQDLVSLATTFNYNNTKFLDFKDIKYEVNSNFIHRALRELGLEKEKDEKHKFLAVLTYLDDNKKIFQCKPVGSTKFKLESIVHEVFGLTEDVHHGLNLKEFLGRTLSGNTFSFTF